MPPAARSRTARPFAATVARTALALLLVGCASPPTVRVVQLDAGVGCTSVGLPPEDATAPPTTVLDQRVRSELLRALAEAGHTVVATDPQCWVRHAVQASVWLPPSSGVSVGVGAGSGGWSGSAVGIGFTLPLGGSVRRELDLTIDLVDVARRQQLWSGTLEAALGAVPSDAEIAAAVRTIVQRAPPPRR